MLYNSGRGVPQSYSEAYFWQNLAAARANGERGGRPPRKKPALVAKRLAKSLVDEALAKRPAKSKTKKLKAVAKNKAKAAPKRKPVKRRAWG